MMRSVQGALQSACRRSGWEPVGAAGESSQSPDLGGCCSVSKNGSHLVRKFHSSENLNRGAVVSLCFHEKAREVNARTPWRPTISSCLLVPLSSVTVGVGRTPGAAPWADVDGGGAERD